MNLPPKGIPKCANAALIMPSQCHSLSSNSIIFLGLQVFRREVYLSAI